MLETQQEIELKSVSLPPEFESYLNEKISKTAAGGRPHLLQQIARNYPNPKDEFLNILECAWIKRRPSIGSIAKKYNTTYTTIYRCLKDLEPQKDSIIQYLLAAPRKKMFYNIESEASDYETVQAYIKRAKRQKLKRYKDVLKLAVKVWKFLNYKDPANWNAEDIHNFLATKTEGIQFGYLVAIRQIAPQIVEKTSQEYVGTGAFKDKLQLHKKDVFQQEVILIIKCLEKSQLHYHSVIFKLHVTLGAREGSSRCPESGMIGLSWDRFKKDFQFVDLYESKVKGGIWCRDCPVSQFFRDLPGQLKQIWIDRGKPTTDKLILHGYEELLQIYKEINQALGQYYEGKLDPSTYKELTTIKPHDSDRIHVNMLWEAEIPLETVAGEYLGRGEGIGLMGRIWLDINTIRKHYLSLTRRSKRFQKLQKKLGTYSQKFNGAQAA
jgi:hypothetical protein